MNRLDRILMPVDLGSNTESIVEAAVQLAAIFESSIRPLFVIEDTTHFPAGSELLTWAARERMNKLHDGLVARGVRCEPPMLVTGKPFDAIVRSADGVNAHLIVLGSGGKSNEPGLGTTTSRVIRRTAKPVLAVRPETPSPIRRILCPVDGSNASARGLRNAITLAGGLKARLTVMTAITDFFRPLVPGTRSPSMAHVASEYEKMEREQFEHFIKGFDFHGVTWDKEVHYGHPADEIVRLAGDAKYDLIVMGSTGRSGLPRILLGSTAETVARRASCSILTVKREDVLTARLGADVDELNELVADGESLLAQCRYQEAIERFDQCLLKDPYLAIAIEGQAAAHEGLGHETQAADLREQAALIRRELWKEEKPVEVNV
jgi:nucleotide-binding universal stress UspA family protein